MAVHVITKVDPAAGQESGSVTDVAEEKPTDSTATEPNGEREYITGARLLAVIASVTVVGFLMLLDMSIIATVSLVQSTNAFKKKKKKGRREKRLNQCE